MDHIFRYISVVAAEEKNRSAAESAESSSCNYTSSNSFCNSSCNYSDNYYGDQVCLSKPSC